MNIVEATSNVRLNGLHREIDLLAHLRPGPHPIISCYLDLGRDKAELANFARRRIAECAAHYPAAHRDSLEAGCEVICNRLTTGLSQRSRGLAMFVSTDGSAPLLSILPFAAPFRNSLTVSSSPDLFPLLQLREMYGRFTFVVARSDGLQVAEVNLGEVAMKAWAAIPGARSSSAFPGNDTSASTRINLSAQVRLVERILGQGRVGPLFLAGDVDVMQAVRDHLTAASIRRLAGVVPVSSDQSLQAIAAICLRSLVEYETHQAAELTTRVLDEMRHNGPAVAGTAPSLRALRNGSVQRLLLGSDYRPEPGWIGTQQKDGVVHRLRAADALADEVEALTAANLRVELIRLAGQHRIPVEFTGDGALYEYGGVACLLHDHPEQQAQHLPVRYGKLDLVA